MVEMPDKVDEIDNVIGATNKEEAHNEGYIHRVAAVLPKAKLIKAGLGDHDYSEN